MKDWVNLEADENWILPNRHTEGRGGHRIEMVVVHHNAGVLSFQQIYNLWKNEREASAHYQVDKSGRVAQLVWDADTAWHAANADINARSIGIEFSNCAGGDQDWPVSDETVESGAHLVAAVCNKYKLGRPKAGGNVRFHREFAQTSCPYHLAPGGKYHARLMERAGFWFDQMQKSGGEFLSLSDSEQHELLDKVREVHHELTERFQSRYTDGNVRSNFRDTLVGYVLELDRKIEDVHANMLPSLWAKIKGGK